MPRLQYSIPILNNDTTNTIEFYRRKTIIGRQNDRRKPELAQTVFAAHMNVRRFVTIETVEEETIGARDVANSWHDDLSAIVYLNQI
jgi:hypothetical protein